MTDKWQQWRPKADPHAPSDWTEESVYSIRALYAGTANEGQQKTAMKWIEYLCGVGDFEDMAYRPGEDGRRATDFAEGKRFVGLQIRKMLHPAVTEAIEQERAREAAPQPKRGAR